MASFTTPFSSLSFFKNPQCLTKPILSQKFGLFFTRERKMATVVVATMVTPSEAAKRRFSEDAKEFVDEMRYVAIRLHTKDQSREGEREEEVPMAKWEPSVDGYLRYLVDSKTVYEMLERIVQEAAFPQYLEFRNTGLERTESLGKDLEWFKEQGYTIPEPSSAGLTFAKHLEEVSKTNPQAFICHFYNTYFAHTAGGRMFGKKVAEKILDKKVLEFYKWDGDLAQLVQNVKDKLNKVSETWTREEKNHCLDETEKAFKHIGEINRLILS